jgi:zinc transport system ATP-binding protein
VNQTIIETHNLHFSYNGQPVIRDVNLKIQSGDFMAMIGPNGGGKTTLLKLMLGLLKADSGSIRIFGKPPKEVSYRIGYVPQDIHINQNFPISSSDVVLMGKLKPGRGWSRHAKEDRMDALQALERVGIGKYCNRRIGELSVGQKQRVFIARKGQNEFYAILKELNQKITIIVVSHDLMVISRYVKSVACVNQSLHYHGDAELTGEMIEMMYDCKIEETCPVELIAHGLPHRVLHKHEDS